MDLRKDAKGALLFDEYNRQWKISGEQYWPNLIPTMNYQSVLDPKYVVAVQTLHGRLQLVENRRSEAQKHFFGGVIRPLSTDHLHDLTSIDEEEQDTELFECLKNQGVTTEKEYTEDRQHCRRHKILNFECIRSDKWDSIQDDINLNGPAYGIFKSEVNINRDGYNGPGDDVNAPLNTIEALTEHPNLLYRTVIIGFGECKLLEDEKIVDQYWIVLDKNPFRISNKKLVQAILPVAF